MTRLHRKTRTGCTQCKRRRVKCDERKPSCANCDRNDQLCSFEFLTPMNSSSRGKLGRDIRQMLPKSPHRGSYAFPPSLSPKLSPSHFDTQTTELLHHYTTIVYISLAGNRTPSVWCVTMPQMGLAHPFLLSGILAISALHLATLLPHRKNELQNLAAAQECAAVPLFRASMSNPTAENIHATLAFAGSIVYYIMASPEVLHADRCRLPSRDDNHPHWFQTMRGLMALLTNHWSELARGPFATLLDGDPQPNYTLDNADDEQLVKLERMFHSSSQFSLPLLPSPPPPPPPSSICSSSSYVLSQDERKDEICREALNELRRVSALAQSPIRSERTETSVHRWLGSVSRDFVELIYERDPKALVLLAHFCVLLKRNDHVWYLKGLGAGLLDNIWQALGEEWQPWIQWAIEQPVSPGFK